MTEKKEITIKKSSISKTVKDLLFAFLISIPILLIVQHFGKFDKLGEMGNTGSGTYGFSSPIDNNMYYYPVDGKYLSDTPTYFQKFSIFYLPSIFIEGYTWLLIMTVIVFILIKLKRKFFKHYNLKIE